MKNLKKLISVIIAVIMLVSSFATVAAADYADVESTNSYAKAIKVLSGLGIAQGDDEGNFNPQNDVKRSEMVAFVCRMMGENDIATASSTNAFTDVAANHWAAGYIAWGVNNGIIKGMGDGTFAPDASVTYQDAVVMIMRALGYDRIAQRAENGGYPLGYLKVASQGGVLANAGYDNTKAATREIIAQLIYNGLTTPLVAVSEYGVSVEDDKYTIYNGKGKDVELRTVLSYTNEVAKVKAVVNDTAKGNDKLIDKNGEHKVELIVEDAYAYSLAEVYKEIFNKELAEDAKTFTVKPYVGATEAGDLLGYTVEAYLAYDEDLNEWKLLAVVADTKSYVTETVTAECEAFTTVLAADGKTVAGYTFEYLADENDTRNTEIDVAAAHTVYWNGVKLDKVTADKALLSQASSITFGGDKNEDYNKIFLTVYQYGIVDSVNATYKTIKLDRNAANAKVGILGTTIKLDAEARENENFVYNIYDANGKAMDIADIQSGDVLNILTAKDAGINDKATKFIDIYVTNTVVEGKVTEQKDSGKYVIDGEEYESIANGVKITVEGKFYISIDGKIVMKDAASAITKNFMFLLGVEEDVEFSKPAYTLRVLTAEGVADLKVAESLKYYDGTATDGNDNYATYKVDTGDKLISDLFSIDTKAPGTITAKIADEVAADKTDDAAEKAKAAAETKIADRFFTYSVNSAGELSTLRKITDKTIDMVASSVKSEYNAEFDEFAGETVGAAKLFVVPMKNVAKAGEAHAYNVDTDAMTIASFDALVEETEYAGSMYVVDGESEIAAVLTAAEIDPGTSASPLAVLKSTGKTTDAEGEPADSLTFVQAGEIKTIVVSNTKLTLSDSYTVGTLEVGDVFQYAVNAEGEIVKINVIFDKSDMKLTTEANKYDLAKTGVDGKTAFAFGVVAEYTDRLVLATDFDADGEAKTDDKASFRFADVEGATFAYINYNTDNAKNMVKVITADEIAVTDDATVESFAAVIRVDEYGKIIDAIAIELDDDKYDTYDEINAETKWDIVVKTSK